MSKVSPESIEAIAMAMLHNSLPPSTTDIRRQSEWQAKGAVYIRRVEKVLDAMDIICCGSALRAKQKPTSTIPDLKPV